MNAWKKLFTHRKFFITCAVCLGVASAVIPPALVVYHRWLDHPLFSTIFFETWGSTRQLESFYLPSYFFIIIPLFLTSLYFFSLVAIIDKVNLPDARVVSANRQKKILRYAEMAKECKCHSADYWELKSGCRNRRYDTPACQSPGSSCWLRRFW